MITAPIPSNEKERLCALNDLKILDTANEERFDILTQEALERFSVPISTITLVDTKQGPRDISFCGHALMSEVVMIVEDTLLDKRFADNPMVTADPPIRFYAGKSLYHYATKLPVGVFCIKDHKPRAFSIEDMGDFLDIARRAEEEINKK